MYNLGVAGVEQVIDPIPANTFEITIGVLHGN